MADGPEANKNLNDLYKMEVLARDALLAPAWHAGTPGGGCAARQRLGRGAT
jgi:hypothetical protein